MKMKPAFTGILNSFVIAVLCAATSTAFSFGFQPKQPSFHSGWVMARSVERDEGGNVKWSTFDAQGKQTPLGVECDETCTVISGKAFDGWLQGFQDFSTQALNKDLVQGAEWMTAEAYMQGKGEFKTVDGQQRMNAPELNRSTRSVYVRSKKQWYTPDSRIVLFESPLDSTAMQGEPLALGDNGAVLLDKDGKLVKSSSDNIGLAVKWFDGERYGAEEIVPAGSRPTNAPIMGQTQIYGGIPGIVIEGPTAFDEPKTVSESGSGDDEAGNRRGFYFLRYLVPCIPNDFVDYQSMLAARLPYSRFSPTTAYPSYTYATRLVSDYCNSVGLGLGGATTLVGLMGNVEAIAVHATLAMPMDRSPIYVDVLYMTGKIKMQNADGSAVQFGGETQYGAINPTAAEKTVLGPFDFDGDGKADRSERGNVDAQQNFTPDAEGDKVAIYLSSDPAGVPVKNAQGQITGHRPHFVRLIDQKMEPKTGGYTVLNTVSLADLKDTDLYLYRTSNGHLVKHQARLTDNDFKNKDGQLPTSGDVQWGYVMNYLGPQAYRPPARSWADLQNETVSRTDSNGESKTAYTDAALQAKREADHLRIGESLTLVAINRKTGYMGTTTARVEAPGSSGSGSLSFKVNDLILRPPNLKIMAVREYEVEAGATKGQMRSYNIGMEGAALKKDKYVEIDSLWLDENDQMLPEDLGTRGYTGRLAKVAGEKLNDTQVSQFSIQPGLHKNMIKLGAGGQGDLGNEHYYLHVSGGVKDDAEAFRKPDFSTLGGDESGIWSSRPKWAVPFKVTTSREVQDLQEQMAFHEAELKAKDDANYIEDLKKLQANYGWEYRPEFQFSVYDLTVQELQRQYKDENGETQTVDLMDDKQPPLLQTNDDLLSVIYDLNGGKDARLPGMGPDPLLAWMLVGQEKAVEMGSDKHTDFSNFDYLKNINALEFLALKLYSNNDAGNILWEYSLVYAALATDNNHDGDVTFEKNADENNQQAAIDTSFSIFTLAYAQQANLTTNNDKTTPTKPFRFWLNNNYDVVNDAGSLKPDQARCNENASPNGDGVVQQKCEQWDEASPGKSNSDGNHIARIESEKDLEDFAPLAIQLSLNKSGNRWVLPKDTRYKIEAHGVGINLFKASTEMKKSTDYVLVADVMKDQIDNQEYLFALKKGESRELDEGLINQMFEPPSGSGTAQDVDGVRTANMIFEGIEASPNSCIPPSDASGFFEAKECYVEVKVIKEGKEYNQGNARLYLTLLDIKNFYDHYSVGEGQLTGVTAPKNLHETGVVSNGGKTYPFTPLFADKNDASVQAHKDDYVLLVHGWRMQFSERVAFAETAFKRMYWMGYRGRFGLFSWPTDWFEKPAHEYSTTEVLTRIAGQEQNYDNSESLARNVGALLANVLNGPLAGKRQHVIAHSMGNVVMSEALLTGAHPQDYIASQAAEVASAYKQDQSVIQHDLIGAGFSCPFTENEAGPEEAWRCYNLDVRVANAEVIHAHNQPPVSTARESEYDMPPNFYSFKAIPREHGPTSPSREADVAARESWGVNYYSGIGSQTNIVNFHNVDDLALNAWEFNQLTKPDWLGSPTWSYRYFIQCGADTCPMPEAGDTTTKVVDEFTKAGDWLDWTESSRDQSSRDILAHIVPARTNALGQVAGTVNSEVRNHKDINTPLIFNKSNQGHSAQFYGAITDDARWEYWKAVMTTFFGPSGN